MTDYSVLGKMMDFWSHAGFEPWEHKGMEGVFRQVTFVKDSHMGVIAEYYAYDYIVWTHRGETDGDYILENWKPLKETMMQRFILLEDNATEKRKVRSFLFGFKGYLEVYHYSVKGTYDKKFRDLVPIIDKGMELAQDPEYWKRKEDDSWKMEKNRSL